MISPRRSTGSHPHRRGHRDGRADDFAHEHLAASDAMIALTRRRPPAADCPEDDLPARSGFFEAAENRDWLYVYRERLAAARAA